MAEKIIKNKKISTDEQSAISAAVDHCKNTNLFVKLFNFIFNPKYFFPIFYGCSGFFVIWVLLVIINIYCIHLKVESAVVSVPIEAMVSPVSGIVKNIFVFQGQHVRYGERLMQIENIELNRDSQLAALQFDEAKVNIGYLSRLLANEQSKLQLYKLISENRLTESVSVLDVLKKSNAISKKNVQRLHSLLTNSYTTPAMLDEAKVKYFQAEESINKAKASMNNEQYALRAIDQGLYFSGEKLEGMLNDIRAQIFAAKNKIILSEKKLKIYQQINQHSILLAPFGGEVSQIFKSIGNTTDAVHPILLLTKTDSEKKITAFLTQKELDHIQLGSLAKIYIPSLGKFYHGRVISLDRTSSFVDTINAQFRWRDLQMDRSAVVMVAVQSKEFADFNRVVMAGMPAIVYFSKKFNFRYF